MKCCFLKQIIATHRSSCAHPTNTPRLFHIEMMQKCLFPHCFNVEYTWSVCRADVLQNRCSQKFCYIIRKAPVLKSLFSKKRLQHRCFPVNIAKFLRTVFFHRTTLMAASELKFNISNLNLNKSYFDTLITAMQTKQILLKRA